MGEILHIPGDWLSPKKHPWAYYFVQPKGNFWVRYHLFTPACHEKISDGLPS